MNQAAVSHRRRRRRRRHLCRRVFVLCLASIVMAGAYLHVSALQESRQYEHIWGSSSPWDPTSDVQTALAAFAKSHGLSRDDWPDALIEMAEKNPETQEFVQNYPLKKEESPEIDLTEYQHSSVPLLLQWDERWGYSEYAGGLMGLTGCGPTCLSMVSIYLLENPAYNPRYIAEFSENNGYSVSGNGSTWTLISEGGPKLGLDVTEIPLDENRILRNLEVGNPIICIMGPGDFTTTGHFIVMTGYENGKIRVNDPNSRQRSETLWEYEQIQDQIRTLWVCRA